ncbi:MAG: MATE family efflux transporter [Spirochaetia bacterium]|nr:MATE family efflux transporter [Spirochaetia bacterium]
MKFIKNITHLFKKNRINRKVLQIAIPSSLGMMSQTAVMITDTIMTGRLGVSQQAAVGLGGMLIWTIMAFLMGGSTGIQIIVSRRIGEKNITAAGQTLLTALLFFFLLGIVITLAGILASPKLAEFFAVQKELVQIASPFLQFRFAGILIYLLNSAFIGFFNATGKTKITMISSFAVAISNIILNYVLIFGKFGVPAYGTIGAAIASSLAPITGMLVFLIYCFQKQFIVYFAIKERKINFSILKNISRLSFGPAMEGFLMHFAFLIFYRFAANISTISVAATNIIVSIMSISFMPGFSFGIAALTLLGQNIGAKKNHLARFAVYRCANYAAFIMSALGIVFIILRKQIVQIFTEDNYVIEDAIPALIIVSLAQAGDAYHMVMSSALRGAGYVYWVLKANVLISFGAMLPFAYYLGISLKMGTLGLWISVFIWLVLLGGVFSYKFIKGKWISGRV